MNRNLHYIPLVEGSTQEAAEALPLPGEEGSLGAVYTFCQQAGRGQGQNKWFGGQGKNIAATFVLEPFFLPASHLFLLNISLSLGVLAYVRQRQGDFLLKWPNDIYWHGRKAGGILLASRICENRVRCLYFGLGLNINQEVFPDAVPHPVSLWQIDGKSRDLHAEMGELADCMHESYACLRRDWSGKEPDAVWNRWKSAYLEVLLFRGQWRCFIWKGKAVEACILDVDTYGRLILGTRSGNRIVADIKEVRYDFDA